MNILIYQKLPQVNTTMLTYTTGQELILRGHNVYFLNDLTQGRFPANYFDWVWAGGNDTPAKDVIKLAKAIGAKCHIHLEGVGCWRVGYETAAQWGYEKELTEGEIAYWKDRYRSWMKYAYNADSCSINGTLQKHVVETTLFDGKPLPNCHLVSCGVDARYALTLPDWDKKNYMVTVSRLEPNKKVFEIAEALILLKKSGMANIPLWIIIGYGTKEQVEKLSGMLNKAGIKFQLSSCFGAEKWRKIKQAGIMLCGLSGIPPIEATVCDVPVLSFEYPSLIEKFEDTIYWAPDNDIEEYANQIYEIMYLKTEAEIMKKTVDAKAKLLNGDLFACTQAQLAEKYEKEIFI